MVWFGWLTVCYFTASYVAGWGGGGVTGSGAVSSPYHYTTWLREKGQGGGLRSLSLTMTCVLSASQIYTQLHLHCAQLHMGKGTQAQIYVQPHSTTRAWAIDIYSVFWYAEAESIWTIYRGLGFLAVVRYDSSSNPPPPPFSSVSSAGDTQEDRERETTCWWERGGGGGGGASSYDGEKAWSSLMIFKQTRTVKLTAELTSDSSLTLTLGIWKA